MLIECFCLGQSINNKGMVKIFPERKLNSDVYFGGPPLFFPFSVTIKN
jgi:hypothetical protein